MTLSEFKAWFDGFTESMEGAPNKKQWERIKARVGEINNIAITREVIYRDRYWPASFPHTTWLVGNTGMSTSMGVASAGSNSSDLITLGRAEYSQMLS